MLEYLFFGLFLFAPLGLAVAIVAGSFFLWTQLSFGVACILISVVGEAFLVSSGGMNLGVNIFLTDLLPASLFFVGSTRLVTGNGYSSRYWGAILPASLLLVVLLFLSLGRGFIDNGQAAGNDFRHFFYFLAVAVYLTSFAQIPNTYRSIESWWVYASVAMALLAVYRWISDALGVHFGPDWSSIVVGGKLRVLTAGQSLFIATGMLMLASRSIYEGGRTLDKVMLVLMGGTVLLLQHRSVWVATIVGVLVIIAHVEKAHRRRLLIGVGWLAVIAGLGIAAMSALQLDSVSGDLRRSLEEVSDKRSTIAGRIDGWFALVSSWAASGFVDMLIGQPMGSGYERYLEVLGRSVKENPHSYYVQILLRAGFVGLVCFVVMIAVLCARLLKHSSDEISRQRYCLLGLLAMNSLFFLVYQARFEQAMILVFAIVMTTSALPRAIGRSTPFPKSTSVTGVARK